VVGVVLVFAAAALVAGNWGSLLVWIQAQQREFFDALTAAMEVVQEQGVFAAWTLIGVSFAYGVFHAVGPGHGKAVVATYLVTQRSDLASGLALVFMAAAFQGLTAIVAIEVAVLVLEIPLRRARGVADDLELVSYVLVALIGAFLIVAALRRLAGHGHQHHHGPVADGSDKERRAWWRLTGMAFAIGLRPCSGALLVLLLAYALQLRWAGVGAVVAMSTGTALAVGGLAVVTVFMRERATGLAERLPGEHSHAPRCFNILALIGGLAILVLGISLLDAALAVPEHPLF
tara:strand:- start:263 stop:1129 length:867 start_codon:yes stop_codon:yes gene_type:complete